MAHATRIVAVVRPVRFRVDLAVGVERRADRSQDECKGISQAQPSVTCHKLVLGRETEFSHETGTTGTVPGTRRIPCIFPRDCCNVSYPCDRITNPPPMPAAGNDTGARGCFHSLGSPRSASSTSS